MRTLRNQIVWCTRAQWALCAVMVATLIAFHVLGYGPLSKRLAGLRGQIAARQQELAENHRKASKRNEIAARNEKLRQELDRLKKPSRQQELPELIKDLERGKSLASLRRYEQKAGVPVRNDLYCALPITMSFEGDFTSIFSFLRSTEDLQRLTRVRNLKLKAKDDRTGQVQACVSMNIYFSTTE
jgi:Tfp pilus assembly protein PilO